jgi:hypothetical protein
MFKLASRELKVQQYQNRLRPGSKYDQLLIAAYPQANSTNLRLALGLDLHRGFLLDVQQVLTNHDLSRVKLHPKKEESKHLMLGSGDHVALHFNSRASLENFCAPVSTTLSRSTKLNVITYKRLFDGGGWIKDFMRNSGVRRNVSLHLLDQLVIAQNISDTITKIEWQLKGSIATLDFLVEQNHD